MASAETAAAPAFAPASGGACTPFERRLRAEWELLGALQRRNPGRLGGLSVEDATLWVSLHGTPARVPDGLVRLGHHIRVEYPRFFPSLPLELYLETPVLHPNVHPETGFVCLWDRHLAAHTVEDALHRTVAILGWKLVNLLPEHTMQREAAELTAEERDRLRTELEAAPLWGVRGYGADATAAPAPRRRRLE